MSKAKGYRLIVPLDEDTEEVLRELAHGRRLSISAIVRTLILEEAERKGLVLKETKRGRG